MEGAVMADDRMNMRDYEATRASFSLDVPARFNYTRDVIDAWAADEPDRLALIAVEDDGETAQHVTFGELGRRADRTAAFLAALGVSAGDRIFVMLPRVVEWYDVLLGACKLGAIPMPATIQLQPNDIAYRIERAEATVAITDAAGVPKVDVARERTPGLAHLVTTGDAEGDWRSLADHRSDAGDPITAHDTASDDPLLIYFTSGTTGHPKMVLHTQASYGIGHQITARFWHDLRPEDVHWTLSDTGWAKAAWGKLFGQWTIGCTVLMWNPVGRPDFDVLAGMIARHGVTTFCAPPTIYRALVQLDLSQYDFSTLRHATAAGEPLNPETFTAWQEATGTEIHDGYGQTETVNIVANYRCLPKKPGSMGKPTPGFDVAVVDGDLNVLGPGNEGQVAVRVAPERPVGLFAGYWHDDAADEASFRGDWYLTGDRAHVDEDGYFWFVSRDDDIIISAGYRIGPFEVESAIIEHPAVAETAVIGVPDPDRGQVVKAFVVLARDHSGSDDLAREIQDHVRTVTAPYKYPRQIEFVEELPKTVSGKIRRVELREREREAARSGS
jgi:acyl-coenzyme A synthetase/AMP-(fatty) acid ligase